MSQVQHCVLILYKHALLGQGIAEHLRARLGVEAMIASADDPQAVKSALGFAPAVVIFEMGDTLRQFDLAPLAPQAVLIDVSTVVARGPVVSSRVAGMERILQAVRDCMKVDEPAKTSAGGAPVALPE
ncbi:MAG: hypothetical protein ABI438_02975 [Dermatophilaceae bacterium]